MRSYDRFKSSRIRIERMLEPKLVLCIDYAVKINPCLLRNRKSGVIQKDDAGVGPLKLRHS